MEALYSVGDVVRFRPFDDIWEDVKGDNRISSVSLGGNRCVFGLSEEYLRGNEGMTATVRAVDDTHLNSRARFSYGLVDELGEILPWDFIEVMFEPAKDMIDVFEGKDDTELCNFIKQYS